ncbi:MAG: carboxypeptidase regulatory-like domain-containing protein, partial [Candidatus Binatia bacterium]
RAFVVSGVPLDPGANTITCTAQDRAENVDSAHVSVTLDTAVAKQIAIVSGNTQTGRIGALLPQPLVVQLTENGTPAVGKVVLFKVLENDGALTAAAATTPTRTLAVTTDTNGQAQVNFTLGTWAGAGNNRAEATATGFVGEALFSLSALPGNANNIVVDAGNLQTGVIGQPLPKPFIVAVIDQGNNRLGGVPVMFRMGQGGGNLSGQQELTVTTDSDGRAQVVLTLGPDEGFDNNVVEANIPGNPGSAASFTASSKVPGDPADTSISGVVLDNSNTPIAGVTLYINGSPLTTQSDEQGQFVLQSVPVGKVLLVADGTTVPPHDGRPWPTLEYELVTIAGRDNTVGMPIFLLPIDTPNGILVDETTGGTLTLPDLPGFALTIVPGSATFPDGTKRGTVSVTLVHADKVPMVPNFGQQPRFIITIQPAGVHFNPPAAMQMPNVDGFAPGQTTEMYSFDHDLGQFVSIGPATVSEDGTVVKSDPGVGVIKGGWHCGGNPATGVCLHNCGECQVCQDPPCRCVPNNNATPTSLLDIPQDCKKPGCVGGSARQVPNDSDLPPANPPGNCLRSDCHEGLTILGVDDSDVPNDDCQTCQNGDFIPVPGCVDTDHDGAEDSRDSDPNDPHKCRDDDHDTCDDCSSGHRDPANDGPDLDGGGLCDAGDPDIDGDGILNGIDNCPNDFNPDQVNICQAKTVQVIRVKGENAGGQATVLVRVNPEVTVSSARLIVNGTPHSNLNGPIQAGDFELPLDQNLLSFTISNNLAVEVSTEGGESKIVEFRAVPNARSSANTKSLFFQFTREGYPLIPLGFRTAMSVDWIVFRWSVPSEGFVGVVADRPSTNTVLLSIDVAQIAGRDEEADVSGHVRWLPSGPMASLVTPPRMPVIVNPDHRIFFSTERGPNWWFVHGNG